MNDENPNPAAMELDPALAAQLEQVSGDGSQHAFEIKESDLPGEEVIPGAVLEQAPEPTSVQPFAEDHMDPSALEAGGQGAEEEQFSEMDLLPEPNENSNPAIAVDELLSAGVIDGAPAMDLATAPGRAVDALNVPTYQLVVRPTPETLEKCKSIGASLGFPEAIWKNSFPIFSQLTEYQAVAFRKLAREIGVEAEINIHFPAPSLTEEEEALGDLAAIPDADLPFTEGAPAVELAKSEKDVMVLVDPLVGVSLRESFGLITAHRSIPRKLFREDEAREKIQREIKKIGSRSGSELPDSQITIQLQALVRDLQKQALQRGANAVVGFQLQTFAETNHLDPGLDQLRLVAFGTAAVVEKV